MAVKMDESYVIVIITQKGQSGKKTKTSLLINVRPIILIRFMEYHFVDVKSD